MQKPIIITVSNDKGGTGKSTITINLAAAAAALFTRYARRNKLSEAQTGRVLVIDADPQGSSLMTITGRKLGEPLNDNLTGAGTLDQYLQDNPAPPLSSAIQTSPLPQFAPGNLDYIPANPKGMNQLSERLPADRDPEKMRRLENLLDEVKNNYRLIFIDTAPKQYWITLNALVASTHVLIPVRLSTYDIDSMVRTFATIEDAMRYVPDLKILGIVPNAVRGYTNIQKELQEVLERNYQELLLPAISHRTAIEESQSLGLDIFSYKPARQGEKISSVNPATTEFLALARAVFNRLPELEKEAKHGKKD